ncbi:hypothetical protein L6164_003465 [Bauhinia variegata]|uniref:Uncharacterized protein n=1 Tax=Bauhinia variegata TaxID=167791 RepID=A0ACB9Q430_BAUVA|nr:hypothetical protein L6164_003465 [Bauhinia variegata]
MAFSPILPLVLFLSSFFIYQSLAEIVCEDLPVDVCAFSVASSGKRCVLETARGSDGGVKYECRTSEVVVERMVEYIETDQCIKACGVDRKSVGISSDALLEPQFTSKLCSPPCYQKCPNIVDLYFNLAAGEGVFLRDLCEKRKTSRREMVELLSGGGAPGPISGDLTVATPPGSAPSPFYNSEDELSSPAPSPLSGSNDQLSSPAPATLSAPASSPL